MSEPFDYAKYDAIPTSMEDVEYRSRLEARWAHFLTSIGYDFRYEFKTFKGPTFRYTPDFWVNIDGCLLIIEVKPAGYVSTAEDRIKWQWMHDTLDETVSFDSKFVVIYGMPYLVRNYGHWGKTKLPNAITKRYMFNWWRQTMPEELAVTRYRNEYREAANYDFENN